jgi:hypothetical protein
MESQMKLRSILLASVAAGGFLSLTVVEEVLVEGFAPDPAPVLGLHLCPRVR